MDNITAVGLLRELKAKHQADSKAKQQADIGELRGGNVGLYEEGSLPSSCPRKCVMRTWYGLQPLISEATQLIFDAGLNSELHLCNELEELILQAYPGMKVLTQRECAIMLATQNKTPIRGSPDFILANADGEPILGKEMKNMNSVYKALGVLAEKPGTDAVSQGALYSMGHGFIPWGIVYTSKTQHHNLGYCFGDAAKFVLKQKRFAHIIAWGTKKDKKTGAETTYAKSLLGFRVLWNLHWEDDTVGLSYGGLYPDGGCQENQPRQDIFWTVVTKQRILDFYELCSVADGPLPPKPERINVDGTKASWNDCDYCEWAPLCKRLDKLKGCLTSDMAELIVKEGASL